jgi:hypothetical protein
VATVTKTYLGSAAAWAGWTQSPTSPATETLSSGIPQTSLSGRNKSAANSTFTLAGTWESLFGITHGSIIRSVTSASCQSKCTAFTTGAASSVNAATLVDGSTTVTLAALRNFSATDASFVTSSGTNATGLVLASNDSVTLTISNSLNTGNSNTASVALQQDNLTFTVTYDPPGSILLEDGTSHLLLEGGGSNYLLMEGATPRAASIAARPLIISQAVNRAGSY